MVRLSRGLKVTCGILFLLNLLFLLFGLALFSFGIYLVASKKFDVAFFEDITTQIIGGKAIQNVGISLIVIGIFTVLLSAFGTLGTLFQNRLFLYSYAVILAVVMCSELAALITAMSLRVRVRDNYESSLWNIFTDAYVKNQTDVRAAVEKLEEKFECCGVYGYDDYEKVNRTIAESCYKDRQTSGQLFEKSCADAIIDWIWDEMPIIGGIIGAVFVLEIFGVISSIAVGVAISHYQYGESYAKFYGV